MHWFLFNTIPIVRPRSIHQTISCQLYIYVSFHRKLMNYAQLFIFFRVILTALFIYGKTQFKSFDKNKAFIKTVMFFRWVPQGSTNNAFVSFQIFSYCNIRYHFTIVLHGLFNGVGWKKGKNSFSSRNAAEMLRIQEIKIMVKKETKSDCNF